MEPAATDPMNSDMAADWGIKTGVRDELKLNERRRSKGSRTVVVKMWCWGWLWCGRKELVWEEQERSWGW
jgi:hypothetical protein